MAWDRAEKIGAEHCGYAIGYVDMVPWVAWGRATWCIYS